MKLSVCTHTGHFIRYTLLALEWPPVCIHSCFRYLRRHKYDSLIFLQICRFYIPECQSPVPSQGGELDLVTKSYWNKVTWILCLSHSNELFEMSRCIKLLKCHWLNWYLWWWAIEQVYLIKWQMSKFLPSFITMASCGHHTDQFCWEFCEHPSTERL